MSFISHLKERGKRAMETEWEQLFNTCMSPEGRFGHLEG